VLSSGTEKLKVRPFISSHGQLGQVEAGGHFEVSGHISWQDALFLLLDDSLSGCAVFWLLFTDSVAQVLPGAGGPYGLGHF
jgi:hypothetical protein